MTCADQLRFGYFLHYILTQNLTQFEQKNRIPDKLKNREKKSIFRFGSVMINAIMESGFILPLKEALVSDELLRGLSCVF